MLIHIARRIGLALGLSGLALACSAGSVLVTVDARSGPWNWVENGLNAGLAYGPVAHDFLPPTVVDLASIGSGAGQDLFIAYKSGLTSAFGGTPFVDQAGHVGLVFKDDVLGSSGQPFPSAHMPSHWGSSQEFPSGTPVTDPENYGVFLNALVAAITDGNGTVLGDPFPIGSVIPVDDGNGSYQQGFVFGLSFQVAQPGAVNLQLGLNDDIFADNTGALNVCIASTQREVEACLRQTPNVPEPAPLALMATAALMLALVARRRRR